MSDWESEFDDAGDNETEADTDVDVQAEPDEQDAPVVPDLRYPSVYAFVTEHLSDIYRRDVSTSGQGQWCPQWWAHGEAVSRLESLWRAWEHLRLDGATGMAVWWKDFADPTMAALFEQHGTFAGCSADRGHNPRHRPLPVEPMPVAAIEWAMSDTTMRDTQPPTTEEN